MVLALACGGDDGGGGPPEAPPLNPDGTPYTFVVDSIDVPTSSSDADGVGLDIDGDGNVDNQLGDIFATIGGVSSEVDLQGSVDTSVAAGSSIVLVTLQATALTTSTGAGLFFYLGENPSNPPCSGPEDMICGGHLDGTTSFDITASSPTDALVTGDVAGGRFQGGPGTITLEVVVAEGTDPLRLNLIGARADVRVSESGLMQGRLGGGITTEEIQTNVLPAVKGILDNVAAPDCTGSFPDCCTPESNGALIYDLFNTEEGADCVLTVEEIGESALVSSFLSPDVDLLDDNGDFNPRSDGVDDALSVAVGFTAVPAVYTTPEP